jgi:branched-chain amino acid aminotransferase
MYLNGEIIPVADARLSVIDHGFLYGDGIFEGIRAYGGRVWKLDEHLDRLYRCARVLLIDLPISKPEMREVVRETLRANGLADAYIRVTVTRGVGLGLDPKNIKNPTVAIMPSKLALYPPEMYDKGLEVVTVSTRIARPDSWEVRVKSTGKYLNNIMAKFEANRMGAGEGLMLNMEGFVAEATGDNIFVIKNVAPDIPLRDVIWGVVPFVLLMFLAIVLISVFPGLATGLPDLLMGEATRR